MATCDPDQLLEDGCDFDGLSNRDLEIAKLQLLCEINGAGTTVTSYTVATLPASPATNMLAWCSDCYATTGAIGSVVRYTGVQWELINAPGVVPTSNYGMHVYRCYKNNALNFGKSPLQSARSLFCTGIHFYTYPAAWEQDFYIKTDSVTGEHYALETDTNGTMSMRFARSWHTGRTLSGGASEVAVAGNAGTDFAPERALLVDCQILSTTIGNTTNYVIGFTDTNTINGWVFPGVVGMNFGVDPLGMVPTAISAYAANSTFTYLFNQSTGVARSTNRRVGVVHLKGANATWIIDGVIVATITNWPTVPLIGYPCLYSSRDAGEAGNKNIRLYEFAEFRRY